MSPEEERQALRQENQELRTKLAEALEALSVATTQISQLTHRVEELEARLAKDSHNSHLPPSSDRFARQKKTKSQRQRSGKKPGGQVGHEGHHLALVDNPNEVVVHHVEVCATCQADIRAVTARTLERRQVVDVPPARLHITEHQAERKCCPHCSTETRAAFPDEGSAPVQDGTRLQALAVYLVTFHLLPFKRAGEILSDVMGTHLSEGTLCQMIARSARVLQPIERQIKIALRQAPVIHQDETGLYVAGERIWMHVTSTNRLTHYQIHAKRGNEALDANGILPGYQGTSVHDGWPAYEGYGCTHALCNVHLLRELIFLEETTGQIWATQMRRFLLALLHLTNWARTRGKRELEDALQAHVLRRYQQVLTLGEQANPPPPLDEPIPKRRGRRKQSPARNLLDRFIKHEEAVLAFVRDLRVPFDNSQAERDIRMVKVQQKISGSFRSWSGALDFCRI